MTEKRVMVVDDDETIRMLVFHCLTSEGYEVRTAENGREALGVLEQAGDFDLILLDMRMPVMSGWEFAKELRALRPGIPVVVFTAALNAADRANDVQADGFLPKPFELDELSRLVKTMTGASHP